MQNPDEIKFEKGRFIGYRSQRLKPLRATAGEQSLEQSSAVKQVRTEMTPEKAEKFTLPQICPDSDKKVESLLKMTASLPILQRRLSVEEQEHADRLLKEQEAVQKKLDDVRRNREIRQKNPRYKLNRILKEAEPIFSRPPCEKKKAKVLAYSATYSKFTDRMNTHYDPGNTPKN